MGCPLTLRKVLYGRTVSPLLLLTFLTATILIMYGYHRAIKNLENINTRSGDTWNNDILKSVTDDKVKDDTMRGELGRETGSNSNTDAKADIQIMKPEMEGGEERGAGSSRNTDAGANIQKMKQPMESVKNTTHQKFTERMFDNSKVMESVNGDIKGGLQFESDRQKNGVVETADVEGVVKEIKDNRQDPVKTGINKDGVEHVSPTERASEGMKENRTNGKTNADDNMRNIERTLKERSRRLQEACRADPSLYRGIHSDGYVRSRLNIGKREKFAYCAIQKTGSTLWKRILLIITGRSKVTDPLEIKASSPLLQTIDKLTKLSPNQASVFLQNATKFLFVRDPFARLFSGYVDKLFSPNVAFWRITGRHAIKVGRKNADEKSLRCGHDLTFAEFVRYVIHAEEHRTNREGHFTPEHDHCHPCQYRYDVIGKMESFKNDTLYLLDRMGQHHLKDTIERQLSSSRTLNDTITDQVDWLFVNRKSYSDCMTFFEAQQRMWKKFQIRGIISKRSKYPVTKQQSESLTKEVYTKHVYAGIGDAGDKAVSTTYKADAMLEAFSAVDRDDLEKLTQIFKADCQLFGYDCRPDKLFNQNKNFKSWFFDPNTA